MGSPRAVRASFAQAGHLLSLGHCGHLLEAEQGLHVRVATTSQRRVSPYRAVLTGPNESSRDIWSVGGTWIVCGAGDCDLAVSPDPKFSFSFFLYLPFYPFLSLVPLFFFLSLPPFLSFSTYLFFIFFPFLSSCLSPFLLFLLLPSLSSPFLS